MKTIIIYIAVAGLAAIFFLKKKTKQREYKDRTTKDFKRWHK